MVELLFVVCLAGNPEICEERSLLFVDISPKVCAMGAQPELAKWLQDHETYTISRWQCHNVDTSSARL